MSAIYDEVNAAMKRIEAKDKNVMAEIGKAPGYAVFPSVGRAGVLLGGSYGHGIVFEGGQPIGEASVGQVTVGVQIGGQTLSLIVIFRTKEALQRLKRGRIAFTANASAAISKAGATTTTDYEKDVFIKAYSQGGMLLEASLGAQGFRFKPKTVLEAGPEKSEHEKPEHVKKVA